MSTQNELLHLHHADEPREVEGATAPCNGPGSVRGHSLALVGVGAIGSNLAGMLARDPDVACLKVIDKDHFEAKNLRSQLIEETDVGVPKAMAVARRIASLRPDLEVVPVVADIEDLPLATLRAEVVLCCVDSRRARQTINEMCWRLGQPFIDAAVDAERLLARVNVYVPAPDNGCLLCSWSDADYELVERVYSCPGGSRRPAPTDAPLELGAMAAALQAMECRKLLAGGPGQLLVGRELMIDVAWHRHYVSIQRPNPHCRFDHNTWRIEPLAETTTLGAALTLTHDPDGAGEVDAGMHLSVAGKAFAVRLTCADCARTCAGPRLVSLSRGFGTARDRCPDCGGELMASGFETTDRLEVSDLPSGVLRASLRALGVGPGEVLSIRGPHGERHFEITSQAPRASQHPEPLKTPSIPPCQGGKERGVDWRCSNDFEPTTRV
jgi:molybdopterin/thiamine biosynthesis adenylyltransferase